MRNDVSPNSPTYPDFNQSPIAPAPGPARATRDERRAIASRPDIGTLSRISLRRPSAAAVIQSASLARVGLLRVRAHLENLNGALTIPEASAGAGQISDSPSNSL